MEFVPSNTIKTPDFGSMAQNAMQEKRQEIKEVNSFVEQNKKKEGAYLEGDKPAVQEAWNAYQKQLDAYVESQDPGAKRKADEAYGSYVQLAGTALANAEQYRNQVAAYKADPSKYSISGQEFLSMSDEYRRTKRSADEIVQSVQNPFVIAQSMKYDLSNPVDQAKKMYSMSSAKQSDFYDSSGNLNKDMAREYAERLATATINANETSQEKALAWGGVRGGYAGGEDGMINSMEELEFLRSQPEDVRNQFVDSYREELVKNYLDMLPDNINNANSRSGKGSKMLSLTPYESTRVIQAEAGTGEGGAKNVEFNAFQQPLKGSLSKVVGFGFDQNGKMLLEEVVEVETRSNGKTVKRKENVIREANPNERAQVSSILKRDYGVSINDTAVTPPLPGTKEFASEAPEKAPETASEPDKPKDSLGLGIFDEAEPAVDTTTETTQEEPVAEEPVAEEPKKKTNVDISEKEGNYVVVNGQPYFEDDYAQVAGKRTGRGTYPETFEDYAKQMGTDIKNTDTAPVSTMLDEVVVTADRIKEPKQESATDKKEDVGLDDYEYTPQEWMKAKPSQIGTGKRDQVTGELVKVRYVPRKVVPAAPGYVEGSNNPTPVNDNPSKELAKSYYIENNSRKYKLPEDFEWTPETVKKAMDRWNTNTPVAPEAIIETANRFGIPVELIIAMAAAEGDFGRKDRQVRTKNVFNWGNSTEGDKLKAGPEQDKYNTYFDTWEDGLMVWADGLTRRYRPESGDWSELWSTNKSFVDRNGDRYATAKNYEKTIRSIINESLPRQLTKDYRKKD